ncbi:DUF1631 domain-containing protein [Zooshikella harenae]|uniref:DUF1631 domain-containing protein n=1 Tax=Zooshikella harenae TaxID=2827238 RepID=A0ABS5Z865_9GAMM|nr:DUF1631 domain-containing protein [Zooshikella harenae]MBU2710185.1 DUF1631 domain-containing protein [Zooshikella harenae]
MTKPENSKIVDLASKQKGPRKQIEPRFEKLLQSCRQITMNHTAEMLTNLFNNVDDAFFAAADQAETNSIQTIFFDAMRELRMQRASIERAFHQHLAQHFDHHLYGYQDKKNSELEDITADQLNLVQQEEFEQTVLLTSIASRAVANNNEALYSLSQRFALLLKAERLPIEQIPFAPISIAECFAKAINAIELNKRIKKALFELFELYVMNELATVYEALNDRLIEADILPNIRYTKVKSTITSRGQSSDQQQNNKATAPPFASEQTSATAKTSTAKNQHPTTESPSTFTDCMGDPSQRTTTLFNAIHDLLADYREIFSDTSHPVEGADSQQPTPSSISASKNEGSAQTSSANRPFRSIHQINATAEKNAPNYTTEDVVGALNTLQNHAQLPLTEPFPKEQVVNELKEELIATLNLGHEHAQPIASKDADIIDLVGMLFDFILDEQTLPDKAKVILSHLHTPYLKLALIDKALFTQHTHPARRLLNTMAQSAIDWVENNEDCHGVIDKIQFTVRTILNEFNSDIEFFELLFQEFDQFIRQLERQAEIIERRTVEAEKGHDRLQAAKEEAKQVIEQAIAGFKYKVPQPIHHFLFSLWHEVLVFHYLRKDDKHSEWQKAQDLAHELLWSISPKLTPGDKSLLRQSQPHLINELRQFILTLGGHQESYIKEAMRPLVSCQRAALNAIEEEVIPQSPPSVEIKPQSAQEPLLDEKPEAIDQPSAEPQKTSDAIADPEAVEALEQSLSLKQKLSNIDYGTWFSFKVKDDWIKLKLSWYSNTTFHYMFVDSSGHKTMVKTLSELVEDFQNNKADFYTLPTKVPLMDRALEKVHSFLKRFSRTKKSK